MIVIAYYFIGSTSVKRILSSRIYNAKAMDERPNPVETDRPTMAGGRVNICEASSSEIAAAGLSAVTQFAPRTRQ
ncbi:MAG: hypothetical protein DMG84_20015 [Acidobacteria bacterium]|nr:MAG: hypothetical protein DMG84_20015 [Acidobacteriota bacterium]